jgi:hypothetical protein
MSSSVSLPYAESVKVNKGKGKVVPVPLTEHQAMKAYWGSGCIAPRILEFGPSRLLHALVPLDRRLGGPQSRSGRGGEEKNFQPLPGLEPPSIQPVVQRYTD